MDKTHRTPELEQLLFDGIASGTPLTQLCRENGIVWRTVYKWLGDPAFEAGMARARALGFDALVDEMLEIADDSRNDWIERDGKEPQRNPESVARSRLRIGHAHAHPGAVGSAAVQPGGTRAGGRPAAFRA